MSRAPLLERAVATLLPQVDALCVYLNGYKRIPRCLLHQKVAHAVLSAEGGWRTGEAKLLFWDRDEWKAPPYWSDDDIAIIVDDDILYPPDYVVRHVEALRSRPRTISCVHGSIMLPDFSRYATDRIVARTKMKLPSDARVHIPGAGTMAFRCGDFQISLRRDMRWSHCVDVMTAVAAKAQGLEVWTIARGERWLRPLPPPRGTGVYRQRTGAGNDGFESRVLKEAGPWPQLGHPPGFEARVTPPTPRRR